MFRKSILGGELRRHWKEYEQKWKDQVDDDGGPKPDSGEVEKPKEWSNKKGPEVSTGYSLSGHMGERELLGAQRRACGLGE